mgnify:CR=1 FL=1
MEIVSGPMSILDKDRMQSDDKINYGDVIMMINWHARMIQSPNIHIDTIVAKGMSHMY